MGESEKKKVEEKAREDAKSGIGSSYSDIAAAYRLGNTSGKQNEAYQKAFNDAKKGK